jgi:hypothetical protein
VRSGVGPPAPPVPAMSGPQSSSSSSSASPSSPLSSGSSSHKSVLLANAEMGQCLLTLPVVLHGGCTWVSVCVGWPASRSRHGRGFCVCLIQWPSRRISRSFHKLKHKHTEYIPLITLIANFFVDALLHVHAIITTEFENACQLPLRDSHACTALSIHTQGMAVAQEERDAAVAQLASARAELAAVTRRAARAEAAADAARTEAERATAASAALVCACVPRLPSLS